MPWTHWRANSAPEKISCFLHTFGVYMKAFGPFVSQAGVGKLKSGATTQESSGTGNLKVTFYLRCTHAILCRLEYIDEF